MAPGRPRYRKRDSYVFNHSAPSLSTLQRATQDLILAYRVFSQGLDDLNQLDEAAINISYGIENGMYEDLMRSMGIRSTSAMRQICNRSYAVYATGITRMNDEEESEAPTLAKELEAPETTGRATGGWKNANDVKGSHIEEQKATRQDGTKNKNKELPRRRRACHVQPSQTAPPRSRQRRDPRSVLAIQGRRPSNPRCNEPPRQEARNYFDPPAQLPPRHLADRRRDAHPGPSPRASRA